MTKLLTPAYVAERLHVKPQTLRLKRMRGDGPPFVRLSESPSARAFYPEAEFLAWLAARPRRISTAEEKRDLMQLTTPRKSRDVRAGRPTGPASVAVTTEAKK